MSPTVISSDRVRSERNCSQAAVLSPVVSGVNIGTGKFYSVARSGWAFQTLDTTLGPEGFSLCVYAGNPVSSALIVENRNESKSVYYLSDLGDERYRLSEVLTVAVEESDKQFIAMEPRRDWFGYGQTPDEAIQNLSSAIVEELEVLSEREAQLGPSLHDALAQLRQVVIRIR